MDLAPRVEVLWEGDVRGAVLELCAWETFINSIINQRTLVNKKKS